MVRRHELSDAEWQLLEPHKQRNLSNIAWKSLYIGTGCSLQPTISRHSPSPGRPARIFRARCASLFLVRKLMGSCIAVMPCHPGRRGPLPIWNGCSSVADSLGRASCGPARFARGPSARRLAPKQVLEGAAPRADCVRNADISPH